MRKNFLLTASALGVIVLAGAAQAQDLSYRTIAPGAEIDLTDTNQATGPGNAVPGDQDLIRYGRSLEDLYLVAQEAIVSQLGSNTFALTDTLSTGSQLPSGNNLYTISLTNGTFTAAVGPGNLAAAGSCTIALSEGGQQGSNSVTFIVSATGGAPCTGFSEVNLPIGPVGPGVVTVNTRLETDNRAPIDGGDDSLEVIFAIDAFQPAFNATFGAANALPGAGTDTRTPINPLSSGGLPYTTLTGDNDLGRLAVYVDTRAQRDLTPGNFVTIDDVTTATVTVTGDFSAFDGASGLPGNPTLTSGTAGGGFVGTVQTFTVTGNSASVTGAGVADNITQLLSVKPNGSVFEVTPDGGQIQNSGYAASINYTLTTVDFNADLPLPATGSFEAIERDGTTFIAPWVSGQLAQSQSVIRLSNTGSATGRVILTLTNAIGSGGAQIADTTCQIPGGVPAAGDLIIDATFISSCTTVPFLRGDLYVTVEGDAENLTAKMRNSNSAGNFETSLGRYSGSTYDDATTPPLPAN